MISSANNEKLKSVHITNYYHKNSGGISTSYNNLLAAALRHRRYVRLIVPGAADEIEDVNEFARIYYITARQSPVFDKRYRMIMPWQFMRKNTPIREILLEEKPDMIEVCDKYTLSFLSAMIRTNNFKKLGRPMLVHFSCERMDDNFASFVVGGKIGNWIARNIMRNYEFPIHDFHLANSVYTAEEFYASLDPIHLGNTAQKILNFSWQKLGSARVDYRERIFVCPRGVNAQVFRADRKSASTRAEMRRRAEVSENAVVLLYAGRVSPEKNIELLFEMMKGLSENRSTDYRLLIAGDGPSVEWVRRKTAQNIPGKIIFLGHLDKELLADYYANADIFVHPNPREPFGIAPLEAMASGVPVVAPDSGGILSYATNENVWLAEPDPQAFVSAIVEITENEPLRAAKISRAIITANENTRERSTDNLFATYDRLFEDFNRRKELFVDREAAKTFDFVNRCLRLL